MSGERSRVHLRGAQRTLGIIVWCREENSLHKWLHFYGPEYLRSVPGLYCIFWWRGGALGPFHAILAWARGPLMSVITIETSLKFIRNSLSISDGEWINISTYQNREKLCIYNFSIIKQNSSFFNINFHECGSREKQRVPAMRCYRPLVSNRTSMREAQFTHTHTHTHTRVRNFVCFAWSISTNWNHISKIKF